jgi:hypothetical protein
LSLGLPSSRMITTAVMSSTPAGHTHHQHRHRVWCCPVVDAALSTVCYKPLGVSGWGSPPPVTKKKAMYRRA